MDEAKWSPIQLGFDPVGFVTSAVAGSEEAEAGVAEWRWAWEWAGSGQACVHEYES